MMVLIVSILGNIISIIVKDLIATWIGSKVGSWKKLWKGLIKKYFKKGQQKGTIIPTEWVESEIDAQNKTKSKVKEEWPPNYLQSLIGRQKKCCCLLF